MLGGLTQEILADYADLRLRIAQAQAIVAHALKNPHPTVESLRHALVAAAHVLATPPMGGGLKRSGRGGPNPSTARRRGLVLPPPVPSSEAVMGVPYPGEAAADSVSVADQEVLQRMSTADTPAQTASVLSLSAAGVRAARLRLGRKLGVTTRAGMVAEGFRTGLLRRPVLRDRQAKKDPGP